MITFNEFKINTDKSFCPDGWRYGQFVFNTLYGINMNLANNIRATDRDMYYQTYVTNGQFEYLERHWEDFNNDD